MVPLESRPTWVLKATAVLCYGASAIMFSGAVLVLASWHLTWPIARYCVGMIAIAAGFVFAGMRNQRMVRKHEAEAVQPPCAGLERRRR